MRYLMTILALALPVAAAAEVMDTSAGKVEITALVEGLDEPWSVGFLPDGGILITERGGRLWHRGAEGMTRIDGVPAVATGGQGGLFDVLVPRDFAENRTLFLSHAKDQESGEGTAITRVRLSGDNARLTDATVIFEMAPGSSGGRHFGGRLVEAQDGMLYLTIGDRGQGPTAQDRSRHNGSVVRIARDGTVPPDNPFIGETGVRPEIWSYGHRNPQGAALDSRGRLWVNEHGARGGDEVNLIEKGANFGWPVISYGTHYNGRKIGEGTEKPGMKQPVHYWDPSIAPSGMTFYSGKLWPQWQGDAFVGSLKFDYIARLDGSPLTEVEQIKSGATGRVRDVREGPDGALYFLSVIEGALYRMSPAR